MGKHYVQQLKQKHLKDVLNFAIDCTFSLDQASVPAEDKKFRAMVKFITFKFVFKIL